MFDPFEMTWFQFDNLIKGRVPFLLINHGAELSNIYNGFYQTQLNSLTQTISPQQVAQYLAENKIPTHHAILILCPNGEESKKSKELIESLGFSNVFYHREGLTGLLADRARYS